MFHMNVLKLVCCWIAVGVSLGAGVACAQPGYPSRTIRLIVSFPPGGVSDTVGRQLAQKLQEQMGQPVIVDNRPGGNFIVAATAAAGAPADGHTIFMAVDSTMTLNPLQFEKLPYDPFRDFAPISLIAAQALFIVASSKAPGRSLSELVAYAKANPGKLTFGASALAAQLIAEQIKLKNGVDMLHVPFKGPPPMLQALLNGEVDFAVTTFVPYASHAREGRLRGLAVTGTRRDAPAPDVPTLTELGYPELTYRFWLGMFAPAGTPGPVLDRLNAEINKALGEPDLAQRLVAAGLEPTPSSAAQLRQVMRDDLEKWTRVVRAANIKLGN